MEEIIIRSLHSRTSAEEERQLSNWRNRSSANEHQYRELERLWSRMREIEPSVASAVPPVDAIIGRAHTSRPGRLDASVRQRIRPSWISWGTAAAAVLAIGFGILHLRSVGQRDAAPSQVAELSTHAGEMATLRLPDGSVVRLAPESRLRFTGTPGVRNVWLDGRAFFAVAKQDGVPFRVRTRAGSALVLGTRFEMRVEEDALRLLVVEGKVALSTGDERLEVQAGEMSHAAPGIKPTIVMVSDTRPMLDWMGEFLVFQSTPLDQFAREFEQHYGIRVRILEESLARRTVTGWFTDQPAEDVLLMVCHAADVHCAIREGVASIEP